MTTRRVCHECREFNGAKVVEDGHGGGELTPCDHAEAIVCEGCTEVYVTREDYADYEWDDPEVWKLCEECLDLERMIADGRS